MCVCVCVILFLYISVHLPGWLPKCTTRRLILALQRLILALQSILVKINEKLASLLVDSLFDMDLEGKNPGKNIVGEGV